MYVYTYTANPREAIATVLVLSISLPFEQREREREHTRSVVNMPQQCRAVLVYARLSHALVWQAISIKTTKHPRRLYSPHISSRYDCQVALRRLPIQVVQSLVVARTTSDLVVARVLE